MIARNVQLLWQNCAINFVSRLDYTRYVGKEVSVFEYYGIRVTRSLTISYPRKRNIT